jgi:hypothetical protein
MSPLSVPRVQSTKPHWKLMAWKCSGTHENSLTLAGRKPWLICLKNCGLSAGVMGLPKVTCEALG